METNQNLARVPQEWKPYESGSVVTILKAQSKIPIRQRSEEDLKEVLRYVMLLVGLRGNNMPTDEEKYVLINFIRSNFGNLTPEEIKLAFEYAIAGKFEIDVKCYENFSCEYFGRIAKAYIEFSRNEVKVKPKEIEEVKPVPSDEELKRQAIDIINNYADQIKATKENNKRFTWIAGGLSDLYRMLVKFNIQNISTEEIQMIWKKSENIKDEEERKNWCRNQAYILLANQLADFDARIDQEGKIKPIEL